MAGGSFEIWPLILDIQEAGAMSLPLDLAEPVTTSKKGL